MEGTGITFTKMAGRGALCLSLHVVLGKVLEQSWSEAEDEGGQSHPAATPGAHATTPHPTHPTASPPSGHTPFYFPLARHGVRLS